MVISCNQDECKKHASAFALMEVVISVLILAMVLSGLIYGYVQINRSSEWNALSLVGQAYATEYVEQARSAQWNSQMWPITNGPGTGDELYPTNTPYTRIDTNYSAMGQSQVVTSTITVITITNLYTNNINMREIRADSWWKFPPTGKLFTNTVITQRGPDQ